MIHPAITMIMDQYSQNHERIIRFIEPVSEDHLRWQAAPHSLSIAFHLWHVARWADSLQATIPGMTLDLSRRMPPGVQIWETRKLAQQWGFPVGAMGFDETGMGMDESQAAVLAFPAKENLLEYVGDAFHAVEKVVKNLSEEDFLSQERCQPGMEEIWTEGSLVGGAIMEHMVHDLRHLGMMESLLGLQSGHGSATV
jgi:hypothetical protein